MTLPNLSKGYSLKGYLGLSYFNEEGEQIPITAEEFQEFIPVIQTAFPNGFTIYYSLGGSSHNGEPYTQQTRVLEVVVSKKELKKSLRKFNRVLDTYDELFHKTGKFWTITKTLF